MSRRRTHSSWHHSERFVISADTHPKSGVYADAVASSCFVRWHHLEGEDTMSIAKTRSDRTVALAVTSAVALVGAAVWTTLIDHNVTVAHPPAVSGGWVASELETSYAWFATTLLQRRLALLLLLVGLAGVALIALRVPVRGWGARCGAICMTTAAALWAVAAVAEAGGQRAVELMAAYTNPIETVATIAFTVGVATSWVQAGAAILLGVGAFVLAPGLRRQHSDKALAGITALVAVAFGFMILAPQVDTTIAAMALAAVLLPIWTVRMAAAISRARAADAGVTGAHPSWTQPSTATRTPALTPSTSSQAGDEIPATRTAIDDWTGVPAQPPSTTLG